MWRYGPLVLWMALIFWGSTGELSGANTSWIVRPLLLWLFPNLDEAGINFGHLMMRKAGHLIEYAILGLLAARAFAGASHAFLRRKWFYLALLLVILYSLSDEFHQSFVPSRGASIYDSFIDMTGGLTAILFYAWKRKKIGMKE